MRFTSRRLLRGIAVAATITAGSLAFSTPASAAQKSDVDRYVQANDHPMGSQIRKHEGSGSPTATAEADDVSATATVYGIDVSGHQGNVDWNYWWGQGKRFAFVKATEGTSYKNPYFAQQYVGSYNRGFIRGAYHFALPDRSSGPTQANFLASNGGAWSRDNQTLPAALDMEWNPYGSACYGKSQAGMKAWIKDFHDTYHGRTGRWPVIYTSTSWWNQCVGGGHGFQNTVPLWVARYNSTVGTLPSGWTVWSFWQYSSSPIDQNRWNGSLDRLRVLANNG
jgi:GH25 family lysozyme M1 (1,4-beta-N-acetylmuramidase)